MIRVVVADDSKVLRSAVRSMLRQPDFDVVADAGDGRAAIAACAAHRPDLLLLDVSMPVMDGIEAGRAIRTAGTAASIMLVTSLRLRVVEDAAKELGAGMIVKPYRPEQLLQAIRSHLRNEPR